MNQTRRTLLEEQGRAHKRCTPMDPTYGRAKAGRPARTYIQQLCEDTGCSPEDLPEAMNDREKWWERIRDIRACSTTWWWWWWWLLLLLLCLLMTIALIAFIFDAYYVYLCQKQTSPSSTLPRCSDCTESIASMWIMQQWPNT